MADTSSHQSMSSATGSPVTVGMHAITTSPASSMIQVEDLRRTMSTFNTVKADPVSKMLTYDLTDDNPISGSELYSLLERYIDDRSITSQLSKLFKDDSKFITDLSDNLKKSGMGDAERSSFFTAFNATFVLLVPELLTIQKYAIEDVTDKSAPVLLSSLGLTRIQSPSPSITAGA